MISPDINCTPPPPYRPELIMMQKFGVTDHQCVINLGFLENNDYNT